ncbi:MAG TPA: CHRD domain-containing protein [Anaerolineales bacterium]|nr:CHRD domain-containing protein [Anaerolineales bacterium]
MKKTRILYIALIALTVLALASIAADSGRQFTTTLTGAAEVNAQGVPNQGDLDGIGTATITLNYGQGTICWEISVSGITLPATAAHIHEAPVTAPGPVVVPLSAPDASGFSSGCTTADRELIKDIIQHPEEYYVNVHNADYQSGALRGQLSK